MLECLTLAFWSCTIVSCAGPVPLDKAIMPEHRRAYYEALAHDDHPATAHRLMMAKTGGVSAAEQAARDEMISERRNPFDAYNDPEAVSRGAVIYEMHCLPCHGANADGRGPRALPDHRPQDFHSFSKRFACTLHRGAPTSWYQKIRDGYGEPVTYPDGTSKAMPAFGHQLSREQIWLVITYLQSLEVYAHGGSNHE